MSDDLVDELRSGIFTCDGVSALRKRAADRIEQLETAQGMRMGATGAFIKQLFEEAVQAGAGTLFLEITSLGEIGSDCISIGPHPGFRATSLVFSLSADHSDRGEQWAFAEEDVAEVRQLIKALMGWVAFIEARAALGEKKDD